MKIQKLFENYLNYLRVKASKGNYDFNKSHISLIENWFISIGIYDSEDININLVNEFLIYLKEERDNTNNSINKNLGCLKRALDFNDIFIKELNKVKNFKYSNKKI